MSRLWIAVLATAGIALVADLLATQLRKRARRIVVPPKLFSEEEPHGSTDGEITVQTE